MNQALETWRFIGIVALMIVLGTLLPFVFDTI